LFDVPIEIAVAAQTRNLARVNLRKRKRVPRGLCRAYGAGRRRNGRLPHIAALCVTGWSLSYRKAN